MSAVALATLDRWVDGRHDIELRDIAHAMNARMGSRGWVWASSRLLCRTLLGRGATRAAERVQELVDNGEFYRVSARGRGQGRGRTLYFKGWANRLAVLRQLEEQRMPLDAIHAAERAFEDYRRRLSFYAKRTDTLGEQHSPLQEGGTTKKDGRTTPDRPLRASHGPPPEIPVAPASLQTPPSAGRLVKQGFERPWNPLNHHGQRLRELRESSAKTPESRPDP
jgi:hypothetical protein